MFKEFQDVCHSTDLVELSSYIDSPSKCSLPVRIGFLFLYKTRASSSCLDCFAYVLPDTGWSSHGNDTQYQSGGRVSSQCLLLVLPIVQQKHPLNSVI